MRASRAYMSAEKYTPSPEQAILINWSGRTVADARAAIDVVRAFKVQCDNRRICRRHPLGAGTQAGKGAEMNENELHLWLELLSQMTEEEKAQFLELLKQLARL